MGELIPAWSRPTKGEHRWPAAVSVVVMIVLQVMVLNALHVRPGWVVPAFETLLLVVLLIADPGRMNREATVLRWLGLGLAGAATVINAIAAGTLVYDIVSRHAALGNMTPAQLLFTGGGVWLTNVIAFALLYWELDSGGPAARANARRDRPDFLFPQMTSPDLARPDWEPGFVDYLYVGFTNATAFSPTDTMPMTRWAKLTMMFQSGVSVVVVALVVARAINILG